MVYKTDYHIHTTFSDGRSAPEEYLAAAASAGISELGFSEHLSLFRENQEWVMNPGNVPVYVEYIANLKKNSDHVIVRTGMEVDYFPGKENEIVSKQTEMQTKHNASSWACNQKARQRNAPARFKRPSLNGSTT